METIIKICLFGGAILVGSVLVYLAVRLASKAFFKSKIEYDKEKKDG